MPRRPLPLLTLLCLPLLVLLTTAALTARRPDAPSPNPKPFRAGALVTDISPVKFPVIVNGMFTERVADKVVDPLTARALALDDGETTIVFCVVDTCMMPRDVIDKAKALAAEATGVPAERMLVSATHTHSAPSVMGCLGSRMDPEYTAFLPGKIAEAIAGAVKNLQPAKVGWAAGDDWTHTFNRRWIRRPDRLLNDPFGAPNVRANMHPGYLSPDVTGPSGPVDPQLSMLAVQTPDGKPLALLANYSMHYIGSDLLSSDYFGRFARHVGEAIGAGEGFVGIMSQGTSGDLASMDYGAAAKAGAGYDSYAREMARRAAEIYQTIQWRDHVPLKMAQRALTLNFRAPDETRLAKAREVAASLNGRLPQTMEEIYSLEAIHLHERPQAELILQAGRVGDFGFTALPNEVYALTGLKLKAQSPLSPTMNIELANGAEGYIPPPEQHALGGYTTWPARTAGLEPRAETKITETLLTLLEEVAGKPRRPHDPAPGPYADAVLAGKPAAYWRFEDMDGTAAKDSSGNNVKAEFEPGVVYYLPGADGREGLQPPQPPADGAFSKGTVNRAAHFAGGRLKAALPLPENYSVEFWLWNGLPTDARAITGYLVSRGADGDASRGLHLGIGGTWRGADGTGPDLAGRLFVFNGNDANQVLAGRTPLALQRWHQVVLVREGEKIRVHLDGRATPEIEGVLPARTLAEDALFLGGRSDGMFNFEGKLDEAAVYPRALSPDEIAARHQVSGLKPPVEAVAAQPEPDSPPLSPLESVQKIHVPNGYGFELVASEPLTMDPVAIDWDLAGRMWVVEMADYPLGMDGNGKPGGRVRVLEDTDGDGAYDKSTLFADGLNFPTGLLTWRDGVIVTAAPDILFLRDTNGDGKADSREVLVSGLLQGNQQLRANGLRWGLDNWVYCAAGGHHGEYGMDTKLRSHRAKREVHVGSRDFRFRPDTGELEPQSGPSQFGRNRDDWNRWFGTQNSRPLWHYVLPDHYLRRNPHVPAPDPTRQVVVPLNPPVWPVSPPEKRYHSNSQSGFFTSACGGMIYRDTLLFSDTPENVRHAFTCEPFHNLAQHNIITDDGVSFAARRDPAEEGVDFFASEDRWCRPVMTRTGPDGALWVVDMYRYMIEHPDWLPEEGKRELLPHYRLGDDKGRVYRVFPSEAGPRKVEPLENLNAAQLAEALESTNEWRRDKAHMALTWMLVDAEGPRRREMIQTLAEALEKTRSPLARAHLAHALAGAGALPDAAVAKLLRDPHPRVRETALTLAEGRDDGEIVATSQLLADDPDPKIRLQLALSLGSWKPETPGVGETLGKLAVRDHAEPFIRAAVLSSASGHARALAAAVSREGGAALDAYLDNLAALALATRDLPALEALLKPALTSSGGRYAAAQLETWAKFQEALKRRNLESPFPAPEELNAFARNALPDETLSADDRAAAARVLLHDPRGRATALDALVSWLKPDKPAELQRAAVKLLASSGDDRAVPALLEAAATASPQIRHDAVEALLGREPWSFALLEGMERGSVAPALDAAQRSRLVKHTSPRVKELAAKVIGDGAGRAKVIEQFKPALNLTGDAARGRAVYMNLCIGCHKLGDAGNDIGPNLQSVAQHSPEKLLANILDPNADVQPGFHAYHCRLVDGTEIYGLIASETASSITFKTLDGALHPVLRRDIQALGGASISLMPEGLEAAMTLQDMADLIALLRNGEAADTVKPETERQPSGDGGVKVGAAAVNLKSDDTMPLAGYLHARYTNEQEGELRAVAVVVEQPGAEKVAIVTCDVLWVTRAIVDPALAEIERATGIPASHVLVNATHTHHAPGTAPAHQFGWSEKFAEEVKRGIVQSVVDANAKLTDATLFFKLGAERTVGANSRLLLRDGSISWTNPPGEAGTLVRPTGPFDPQLPVLDFRAPDGKSLAILFNHSTHTIGTRSGRDVRSPSFYGLAAQELETETGAVVGFVEGASGSTHNIRGVSTPLAIERMKNAVRDTRAQAEARPVHRVTALKRPFVYRVRKPDDAAERAAVARYAETYAKSHSGMIQDLFADARREIMAHAGEERQSWLQVVLIGDVAFVGIPAEYFTALGLDIKRRSPFKHTYIAELANDWIGYLPDLAGHAKGGYQTWTGLHSYCEPGTGERAADEAVKMLEELAQAR